MAKATVIQHKFPPFNQPMVYRLKHDFQELENIIKGGITSIEQRKKQLKYRWIEDWMRGTLPSPASIDQQIVQATACRCNSVTKAGGKPSINANAFK